MFIWRMNAPNDRLRLLNNVDVTLSSESRMEDLAQITNYEIDIGELVVRLTRSDISLITSVVDNAVAMSAAQNHEAPKGAASGARSDAASGAVTIAGSATVAASIRSPTQDATTTTVSTSQSDGNAKLFFTREELRVRGAGAQFILISEVHMLPFLDMHVQPFEVYMRDWSADLVVKTGVELYLNSFNLSTSHWEPLIEPWSVSCLLYTSPSPRDS